MPQNQTRTSASDSHTSRRRHAAPGTPTGVRKAGLVGGVVSVIALCGAAAPAIADSLNHSSAKGAVAVAPAGLTSRTATASLSTAVTGEQAAQAIDQASIALSLRAAKADAAAEAAKDAAAKKKAAEHKAAEAAKAAKAADAAKAAEAAKKHAAAVTAASRSTTRTKLAVVPVAASSPVSAPTATPSTATGTAAKLISFLKAQIGKPYVYGATGPDSYDCSGLTQVAYQSVGITLPRTSQEQSNVGTPVAVSAVQAGDLIFWGGQGSAYHVGVYIGGGQYLDAANPSTPVGIKQMADYMPDWAVRVL